MFRSNCQLTMFTADGMLQCDGKIPCGRCSSQGGTTDCVYDVSKRQSKDDMRKEIVQLRAHQQQTEQILRLLTSHEDSEDSLKLLRNGDMLQDLTVRLRSSSLTSAPTGNVTTYARLDDHQAINHALEPIQSIGAIPHTTQPFEDAFQMSSLSKQSDPSELGSAWRDDNLSNQLLSNYHQPNAMN